MWQTPAGWRGAARQKDLSCASPWVPNVSVCGAVSQGVCSWHSCACAGIFVWLSGRNRCSTNGKQGSRADPLPSTKFAALLRPRSRYSRPGHLLTAALFGLLRRYTPRTWTVREGGRARIRHGIANHTSRLPEQGSSCGQVLYSSFFCRRRGIWAQQLCES